MKAKIEVKNINETIGYQTGFDFAPVVVLPGGIETFFGKGWTLGKVNRWLEERGIAGGAVIEWTGKRWSWSSGASEVKRTIRPAVATCGVPDDGGYELWNS